MENHRVIRLKVKAVIKERGLTQKDLAKMAGLRANTISDMVRGSRTVINFEHLARVAEALGVTDIRELIDFDSDEQS
jgi:transcriptional regulator with XRE-family HTH domain